MNALASSIALANSLFSSASSFKTYSNIESKSVASGSFGGSFEESLAIYNLSKREVVFRQPERHTFVRPMPVVDDRLNWLEKLCREAKCVQRYYHSQGSRLEVRCQAIARWNELQWVIGVELACCGIRL